VEPEGVDLLDIGRRAYAFIGLERTTKSAVAIFDITNPRMRGHYYLAIANEVIAAGATTSNTTLYRLDRFPQPNCSRTSRRVGG
jgi:hypothetical protein